MGNCLVTKLKGVVDNDNLIHLNEFRVNARVANNGNPAFRSSETQSLTILKGDATFTGGVKSINIGQFWPSERFVTDGAQNIVLSVADKHKLTHVNYNPLDIESIEILKYCTALTGVEINIQCAISVSELVSNLPEQITILNIAGSNQLEGNIKELADAYASTLTEIRTWGTTIVGDFGEFGRFVNITTYYSTPNGIRGDVIDFVTNKRAAGVTSGSVTAEWLGGDGRVKFNGNTIQTIQNNTISWTADTITVNGETITA